MRKNIAITLIGVVLLASASISLSACNTVEGAGRDVSKAGSVITDEAKEHK